MNSVKQRFVLPSGLPACVGIEEAAQILGWPDYFLPVLMRTGLLKPLGKPSQSSRKWFSTVELERLGTDPVWLDKAVRTVEKHVHDMNEKRRGKLAPASPPDPSLN
ncbi:MAG: hypothetical protein JWO95_1160 [Verrucomicrobiales bacterium]|nr:hypothetical protein [Verrucomicrobiales bacterium]